jgi:hypothetical protein
MPLMSVHIDSSGRRQDALTREPGDLPSFSSRAGRGASATVEFISTVREGYAASRLFRTPNLAHEEQCG